ncbi:hypothetical protein N312_12394, partial [Balearica regulorum gibbericeps]
GALARPHADMDCLVTEEVGLLVEGLLTLRALVGLLLGVNPLMPNQIRPLGEALPTLVGAFEGLLPLVDLLVGSEGPLLHKALPTLRAGKWPLLCVGPHVDVKVDLCAQALATAGTEVGTTLGMCLLVGSQAYLQAEATPAFPTAEGPLSCVDALVGREVALGGEAPPTVPTSEELLCCVD